MVKVPSDPKVYAVAQGGVLRWISSEAVAVRLYGADWNKEIDDIPASLVAGGESEIDDARCVSKSFPGFFEALESLKK